MSTLRYTVKDTTRQMVVYRTNSMDDAREYCHRNSELSMIILDALRIDRIVWRNN